MTVHVYTESKLSNECPSVDMYYIGIFGKRVTERVNRKTGKIHIEIDLEEVYQNGLKRSVKIKEKKV